MPITQSWNEVPCLDLQALWRSLEGLPHQKRLSALLSGCEVAFHDQDKLYAKRPRVLLAAVGGRTLSLGDKAGGNASNGLSIDDLPQAISNMQATMGYAGMMSYLNPRDRGAEEMLALNLELHGVPSTAHAAHLGVFVAGLSAAAELELACQRDIVHLSRVTNARSRAMDNPPFLVRSQEGLPRVEALRLLINESWPLSGTMTPSQREERNTLWPMSKCSAVLITGSIKNLAKLSDYRNDSGKEDDLRNILQDLHELLRSLFPELLAGPAATPG